MRLRSWLTPKLEPLGKALSAYRVNARALVFAVACWLLYSGVREFSAPAARIVLGTVFMIGLLWPDRREKGKP